MAIPKIIHYCWFGGAPLSDEIKQYIDTWKKHCPDYEIKEWNESNFDVKVNKYVEQAYGAKKYAFVSDYARLNALYTDGGIYMDTDVEVLKSLDEFLGNKAVLGFESNDSLMTGLIASEKGGKWVKTMLDDYSSRTFIKEDGSYDLTTNVVVVTSLTEKLFGLERRSSYQELGELTVYPNDYFSPQDWDTGIICLTENSHTIHHFAGSWHDEKSKKKAEEYKKRLNKYIEKYGREKGEKRMRQIDSVKFYLTHPHKVFKKIITGKRD